jgi:hypothetical protein
MFLQQGPKLFFECHLSMMNFLARNRTESHSSALSGRAFDWIFPGVKTPG